MSSIMSVSSFEALLTITHATFRSGYLLYMFYQLQREWEDHTGDMIFVITILI